VYDSKKQVKGLILFILISKNIGLHKSMGNWLQSSLYSLWCLSIFVSRAKSQKSKRLKFES